MLSYKGVVRPLLFTLPPEWSHMLGEQALRTKILWRMIGTRNQTLDPALNTTLAGIPIANPLGVAAGCDKDCTYLDSLKTLGFGYVVGGTVTLNPHLGNPRPRLMRRRREGAIVNSMGFPSQGMDAVEANLRKSSANPLILSISGFNSNEFVQCYQRAAPLAQGIELNVSCPNAAGLHIFQWPNAFQQLLERINDQRTTPLFVKIPHYYDAQEQDNVLNLVRIARQLGVDGITAANTKPVEEPAVKIGRGGLSGKPLLLDTLRIVADVRREVGDTMTINACGGISCADDVVQALENGADTVQIYTALVYEGPGLVKKINRDLSRILRSRSLDSIRALSSIRVPTT
jgi:dihydroorotate dehydrogenase subfamily 2